MLGSQQHKGHPYHCGGQGNIEEDKAKKMQKPEARGGTL